MSWLLFYVVTSSSVFFCYCVNFMHCFAITCKWHTPCHALLINKAITPGQMTQPHARDSNWKGIIRCFERMLHHQFATVNSILTSQLKYILDNAIRKKRIRKKDRKKKVMIMMKKLWVSQYMSYPNLMSSGRKQAISNKMWCWQVGKTYTVRQLNVHSYAVVCDSSQSDQWCMFFVCLFVCFVLFLWSFGFFIYIQCDLSFQTCQYCR